MGVTLKPPQAPPAAFGIRQPRSEEVSTVPWRGEVYDSPPAWLMEHPMLARPEGPQEVEQGRGGAEGGDIVLRD